MQILLRKAKILDSNSPFHRRRQDILIRNGKISKIDKSITSKGAQVIESKNLHVSPGWLDIGTQVGEPGYEHRETIQSVAQAARKGGYTGLAIFPNTNPVLQTKADINYVRRAGTSNGIDLYPIGALSENCGGKEITEMIDMHVAGAVAFSDGKKAIVDNGLMQRALLYTKAFDGLIINQPFDPSLAPNGILNEGKTSTLLGVKGIPHISEYLMVQRDLALAEYTGSKLHLHAISTSRSVGEIREARKNGIHISCSVSSFHVAHNDEVLLDFNSNFKLNPPLRTTRDIASIVRALKDGTIDHICSSHEPLEEELKKLEFTYADFGAINLQTCFASANSALKGKMSMEVLVDKFCMGPRDVLGLPVPVIDKGKNANLTAFDPDAKWTFTLDENASKSINSPYFGQEFTGRVLGSMLKEDWIGA